MTGIVSVILGYDEPRLLLTKSMQKQIDADIVQLFYFQNIQVFINFVLGI